MKVSRQVLRATARRFAKLFRRAGADTAGGGRRLENWPMIGTPQATALSTRGPSKARATEAAMNTAPGNRIVETWMANLVGKGFQARPEHPDPDVKRNLAEDFEALVAQHLPLIARCVVRDGEAVVRIVTTPDGIALRVIPADQLDSSLTRELAGGARIVAGIEFDANDEVIAYHILREAPGAPFSTFGEAVRVPATDILHIFDRQYPGQVRGISWLTPVLLKLRDRDEASDALLMQLKTAALITGYIRDPDGGAGGFDGAVNGGTMNVSLEPGAMRILPPGADVTFSSPGNGPQQSVEFLRAQDREIAAGVGLTTEQLTGDLTQTNYSSARVGLLEFRRRAEMLQRLLIEGQLLRPLWRRWIDRLALAGDIPSDPGSLADYRAVRFVAPGWQWVDPKNEVEAEVAAIEAGLKSREEVVAGRGRDIDELDAERARDNAEAAT